MRFYLLLSLVACVGAVTNCGIGTDPFFATVSYNSREDMWRADAIVTDYNEENELPAAPLGDAHHR